MLEEQKTLPRADFLEAKKTELLKIKPGKHIRKGFEIEIVDIKSLDKGIEIFVRAWKDSKQVGFGDGTVDIERFKVYNPPVLVPDEEGTIVRESTDEDGTVRFTFREDPQEAILQTLEHNLTIIPLFPADNIEKEKVGNTVSTFYPDAGIGNTTVDGDVIKGDSTVWNTTHDATDGSDVKVDHVQIKIVSSLGASLYRIERGFTLFNTAALPDTDTISSATLSTYSTTVTDEVDDAYGYITIVTCSPASDNDLVVGDFDQCGAIDNPTEQIDVGERKDLSSFSTGSYLNFALNATGIGNISKTGITKFGIREGHDTTDNVITTTPSTGNFYFCSSADETGTSQDPKLVVTHAGSSTFIPRIMMS